MYDAGKIGIGIVIFLCFITFPIWYNVIAGNGIYQPDPKIITTEKNCVESAEYMRVEHMTLIYEWRDEVVREGNRMYKSTTNHSHLMSLTNTCLKCHSNKSDFCDECHNYAGVTPYCWECHVDTEKLKKEGRL